MYIPNLADRMSSLVFEAGNRRTLDWKWLDKSELSAAASLEKASIYIEKIQSVDKWASTKDPAFSIEKMLKTDKAGQIKFELSDLDWYDFYIVTDPTIRSSAKETLKILYTICEILAAFLKDKPRYVAMRWGSREYVPNTFSYSSQEKEPEKPLSKKMNDRFLQVLSRCLRSAGYKVFKKDRIGIVIHKFFVK